MSSVTCTIKGYQELKKEIQKMRQAPKKVLDGFEGDIKKRAPGWIAQGVVKRYNLEGSVNEGKRAVTNGGIGDLEFNGSIHNGTLSLKYTGRKLSPKHFGMDPTIKPKPGTAYTMKWKVLRGGKGTKKKIKKLTKKQLKNIGRNFTHQSTQNSQRSPWMLQPTGAKDSDKTQYIPFQRRGQTEPFGYVARTVSLPQMVTKGKNGNLHDEIAPIFNEKMENRYNHYVKRYMGK